MKAWEYFLVLLLAVIGLGATIAWVVTVRGNEELQQTLQSRQVQLNGSVLAPQAQQIANSILQEMGRVAATNEAMRQLLAKHGYSVAPVQGAPAGESRKAPTTAEEKP